MGMQNGISLIEFLTYGLAGYIALALAVALTVMDIVRYRRRLRLTVSHLTIWNTGNQSLVLFHLILVNPSSSGRTVLTHSIGTPIGITGTTAIPLRNEQLESAYFLLPNGDKSPLYPESEILRGSLDIPPHQSVSRIVGQYLTVDSALQKLPLPYRFWVFVHDIDGKQLAKVPVKITLEQLTTDGIYRIEKMVLVNYK